MNIAKYIQMSGISAPKAGIAARDGEIAALMAEIKRLTAKITELNSHLDITASHLNEYHDESLKVRGMLEKGMRTNGEGWFLMHPPMHALYHLPNLVTHPTARPDLKPTPWLTWRLKSDANRACGCPLLGQIAAAIKKLERFTGIDLTVVGPHDAPAKAG